jgi:DNA replication and repair protein RecF
MKLKKIEIKNFRNLEAISISLEPGVNIFCGENGSGKTSFLEAIYFLFRGKSFRSRSLSNIIAHGQDQFVIHSSLFDKDDRSLSIGVEKRVDGIGSLRVAGRDAINQTEMASILPVQLINPDGYLLLESGSALRRKYLDWGVFHVEQSFISWWRKMKHIIQQRNALLKSGNVEQINLWDEKLAEIGVLLHAMRANYLENLRPVFFNLIAQLLPDMMFDITYEPGWDVSYELVDVLKKNLKRDLLFGYTGYGPHRADLKFTANNKLAYEVLSRGQQKMLIFALLLAQGVLLYQQTSRRCLFLIDDLPSELDSQSISSVASVLFGIDAQVFVTAIEPTELLKSFEKKEVKLFHVEHGKINGG